MGPGGRKRRHGQITRWKNSSGVIRSERNFGRVSRLFELGSKSIERTVRFLDADQDAAARLAPGRSMHGGHFRDRPAGRQPSDVDHFVGADLGEDALQSTPASSLLNHKGKR